MLGLEINQLLLKGAAECTSICIIKSIEFQKIIYNSQKDMKIYVN